MWSVLSELGTRRKGQRAPCGREIELRFSLGSRRAKLEIGRPRRAVGGRTLANDFDAGQATPGWREGKWDIEGSD